ncbi:MAG TPA: copper resistance CopC family protein [Candidatus Limnocylindria bacterium]|nr:copper resistance CopC family protein [Candidatus Limnocylindria bacterium]
MSPVPRRLPARATMPIALLLLTLLAAAPAAAHAELVDASPPDGARLATVPDEVVLHFSDELDPADSSFTLTGPDGAAAGTGSVDLEVADRNVLRGRVSDVGTGTYRVDWVSVAADGHEERGTLSFTVGQEPLANTALRAPSNPLTPAGWLLLIAGSSLLLRRVRAR